MVSAPTPDQPAPASKTPDQSAPVPQVHDQPVLVVGDWGTSSLRLWAISATGAVLAGRRSAEGMATLAPQGFEPVLRSHLAAFGTLPGDAAVPLPVLLCGMAGARQGWAEAPYADLPADIATICGNALRVAASGLDVRILPGLARRGDPARADVMRGEETQLLGVLQGEPALSGVVVIPGTHSKWVHLQHGSVLDFETAMTGELYALLSRHSILRHSVAAAAGPGPDGQGPDGQGPDGQGPDEAFVRGAVLGLEAPQRLSLSLFGIRAASLLHGIGGEHGASMLSGLLIGAEVGGVRPSGKPPRNVVLVATGTLAKRYALVLRRAGCRPRVVDAEQAALHGLLQAARRLWPDRIEGNG